MSEADRLLVIAETLHAQMLCPCGSGSPHYLDETSQLDGWHEGDVVVCDVKRAADQYRREHPELPDGAMVFVTRED